VDKKQDEFKVKVDTKYGKYVKLGIAMLTTFAMKYIILNLDRLPSALDSYYA
jgi:hypothetical protein